VLTYGFSGWMFDVHGNGWVQLLTAPGARMVTQYGTSLAGAFRVDSIQDPDGARVRFGAGSGVDQFRVQSRTDRRGKVTTFGWDAGSRLAWVHRPAGVRDTLWAAETRGLGQALPLDSAFAQLNGPRTDVADLTRVWVNGYGAPVRVRDALGRETRVSWDATWPGLVRGVMTPSRLVTRRTYNARGLPVRDTVLYPPGDGRIAVTLYSPHPTLERIIGVHSPLDVRDTLSYDAATGLLLWAEHGGRRTQFFYTAANLVERLDLPGIAPDAWLAYDGLGNPRRFTSPAGRTLRYYRGLISGGTSLLAAAGA
jgi:YD repeat-containing protein